MIVEKYSKILFKQRHKPEIIEALKVICKAIDASPKFMIFIHHARDHRKARDIFRKILEGKAVDEFTINFLDILAKNQRIKYLTDIVAEYEKKISKSENIMSLEISSAKELKAEDRKLLTESLEKKLNKKISVDYKIKKSIIGGIIVKSDDVFIDASVQGTIKKIENSIDAY